MSRPKADISAEQVMKLASIGCTYAEMAAVLGCNVSTLQRRFAQDIETGREQGKSSVRRMMWRHGEQGNSVALKYLVHNVLKEKIEDNSDKDLNRATTEVFEKLNSISTDMILKLVKDEETA